MNKVSIKSKKEQIKALENMRTKTEENIDTNFVEIIDIKTDLEEVEQFIQSNPTLNDIWLQIDTNRPIQAVKIENKNQTDLNTVIGNMFQKYCLNNKEQINKLATNKIFEKMRDINEQRKQAEEDAHPTDVQDILSEIRSDVQKKDPHGQSKTSQMHSHSHAHPKPVTLNQMLTNSVSKLTLNPYIKTMIHTNEFNNEECGKLKKDVKDMRLKKEFVDQFYIHYNTDQLNFNKHMIESNSELKMLSKNPGGKQRNPKLDQNSRYMTGQGRNIINAQESPPRQRTEEEFNINEEHERKSREKTNRRIKDNFQSDAFVLENLNNKKFTEN